MTRSRRFAFAFFTLAALGILAWAGTWGYGEWREGELVEAALDGEPSAIRTVLERGDVRLIRQLLPVLAEPAVVRDLGDAELRLLAPFGEDAVPVFLASLTDAPDGIRHGGDSRSLPFDLLLESDPTLERTIQAIEETPGRYRELTYARADWLAARQGRDRVLPLLADLLDDETPTASSVTHTDASTGEELHHELRVCDRAAERLAELAGGPEDLDTLGSADFLRDPDAAVDRVRSWWSEHRDDLEPVGWIVVKARGLALDGEGRSELEVARIVGEEGREHTTGTWGFHTSARVLVGPVEPGEHVLRLHDGVGGTRLEQTVVVDARETAEVEITF